MLLESSPAVRQQEEEPQSPRALFQSIRSLIAEASDIQERYQAAALPGLQALFTEKTDFALHSRQEEEARKALAGELRSADTALSQRTGALEARQEQTADVVTEHGAGEGFAYRLWQSGRAELWGSFPVQASAGTPLALPLPFPLKNGLALVQGLEFEALSIGESLSLTPLAAGETQLTVLLLGEKEDTP